MRPAGVNWQRACNGCLAKAAGQAPACLKFQRCTARPKDRNKRPAPAANPPGQQMWTVTICACTGVSRSGVTGMAGRALVISAQAASVEIVDIPRPNVPSSDRWGCFMPKRSCECHTRAPDSAQVRAATRLHLSTLTTARHVAPPAFARVYTRSACTQVFHTF